MSTLPRSSSGLRAALRYWQEQRQRPWLAAVLQTLIVGGTAIAGIVLLSLAAQRLLLDDLRRSLGHVAMAAALQIDGDLHQRLVTAGKATHAEYEEAVKPLRALVRANPDLRYAYTGIIRGGTMYYVVDADTNNPSDFLEADSDPPLPGELEVWRTGQLTVADAPTATPWVVGIRAYAPIRDARGRMVAYVGVTMRAKRYQAEIARIRSGAGAGLLVTMLLALASGVSMWVAQNSRNQALQAAVAAAAAKREFLATMSHEIRTPLNGILGLNELLLNSDLQPQQRQWVSSAQASGQHLLGVVNDILDFSRIEAGHLELEAVEFGLVELIQETLDMFALAAQQKGLQLSSEFEPGQNPPRLLGDAFRLRQVLSNLIGNALKFTERGRVVLMASHRPAANGRVAVTLCVADTGIGIAPVAQEKIFEHFLQADGSTTRRYGGTGLGLAISRRLVEKMGGSIRVESTAGYGSRFYVELELPAAKGADSHPSSPKAVAAGDAPVQMSLQGAVLLVEDNPINQMVATAMLEKLGVAVTLAEDGVAAVEKVKTRRYDLVLMDCQMPVMDGYEATALIRADTAVDPQLRIIAVTANTMPGDDEKCRAAGMNDVLAKPFSLQQLRDTLERWLPPPVQRRGDTAARASA